jgi:hypothetical protein
VEGETETWKDYLAAEGRYTLMAGETCDGTTPRSACSVATAELERFGYSLLHLDWHPAVIARWKREGCFAEISRRLGYSLSLAALSMPSRIIAGGDFAVNVTIKNEGYAAPFGRRPVFLVFERGVTRYEVMIPVDPRTWYPGDNIITLGGKLPADAQPGMYRVSLWLPDRDVALRNQPMYAIRLDNRNMWLPRSGLNVLATAVPVTTAGRP